MRMFFLPKYYQISSLNGPTYVLLCMYIAIALDESTYLVTFEIKHEVK